MTAKPFTRRSILKGAAALTATSLLGVRTARAADPPPEITTVRIPHWPISCIAPLFIGDALLKAEGFTDVQYIDVAYGPTETAPYVGTVGPGKGDFDLDSGHVIISQLDSRESLRALTGAHLGCYELFGSKRVRSIRDLKGKTVPVDDLNGSKHVLLSSMAGYVGLNPARDIDWIEMPSSEAMDRFAAGELETFLGFPPEPQALRARGFRDVIINTGVDKPWSQYYCCMLIGSSEFVDQYPIATKRVVRAMLKAADLCARDPVWAARQVVNSGFVPNYEHTLEALKDVKYNVWRTHNPEDTLRFYGLRLYDVGMIKTPPNELIARGTDWRFLEELKRELKA